MWRIAAPMILSNISVPLLGMVDTAVTGHLDDKIYLGAVAIGATIFSFLYMGLNFLRMGTTGISAQCFGANDNDGLRTSLGQALIVATLIAVSMIALQLPIGLLAVKLIGANADISALALEYFSIRIWSAPGTLANYALIGWFLGLQNARVPMIIFLTVNITNIILDLVFVLGLGMKVDGVALASVFAEYTGLAVAITFALRAIRQYPGQWIRERFLKIREYAVFFQTNSNLFVRTMALMFTLAFVTAQGARLGALVLAANAVLVNLQHLTSFGLDAFAHAAEALVGKAIGARQQQALQRSVHLTMKWSLIFSVGFTLAYIFFGPLLIRVMTDLPEVREAAMQYLPWIIVSPMISVWAFLYDGVFVGATRAREMRNIMVFSTVAIFLPAWYLLQGFGNHGLWLALMFFMASRGIGMHIYYKRRVQPAI